MEDNNVNNNIILNNENEISTLSTISSAEGKNLDFSYNTDETTGSGGGGSSLSSGSTSASTSNSDNTSILTSGDLTPILLILSDNLDPEHGDDSEEPVLLEEDNSLQYTIELNTTLTEIYTINAGSNAGNYYADEEHVIAVLDSNNTIIDNENNEGDIKITAKIDLSWCTVSFVHPLNSPFQYGKYNLNSDNFSHDNDIKVVVPMIHCDANTGNLRTANIIFLILNLDTNLKMLVNQDGKNEGRVYKYTIYMVIAINISRKIDVFGNTADFIIKLNNINSLTIVNGQYNDILEPTLKYNLDYDYYIKEYNYVVSRLMYAHDIVLSELLTDDNDKLKLFINNLNKSECLTEVGGLDEFKSLTYLQSSHKKNINDILGITNDYINSDSLVLYQGKNYQENTYWEILNDDLTTSSRYNPFDDLGSFIGNNNGGNSTIIKKICNITTDDLHLIIYNLTLNTVVKDINWTNWTKKN